MRLINVHSLEMREFVTKIPPYAILSHRWSDDEVTFKEFRKGSKLDSIGYQKVKQLCELVKSDPLNRSTSSGFYAASPDKIGSVQWVWSDTCCIDKRSSAELSEAINSMFEWYWNAQFCVAYLSDVPPAPPQPEATAKCRLKDLERFSDTEQQEVFLDSESAFVNCLRRSEWFERAWTLQELLASKIVLFCNRTWDIIGKIHKEKRAHETQYVPSSLWDIVSDITKVSTEYIKRRGAIPRACFAEKMNWVAHRKTTRPEDLTYSLLGLVGVNMPLLYGEGAERAFLRLQKQYILQSDDESIFAWNHIVLPQEATCYAGILATSPLNFSSSDIVRTISSAMAGYIHRQPYSVTNKGLSFESIAYKLRISVSRTGRGDSTAEDVLPISASTSDTGIMPRKPLSSEMPPDIVYAVPLNCRTRPYAAPHDWYDICRLGNRDTLFGPSLGNSRVANGDQNCFLLFGENKMGETTVERVQYLVEDHHRVVRSRLICNGKPEMKHFLVRLQT